jgi:hypothetical protein
MTNTHNQAVPDEVLADAQKKLNEIAKALAPYLTSLSLEQRRFMPKMGDKSLAFVSKAHEMAGQNPALCPSYLNMADFDIDMADAKKLLVFNNSLQQLQQAVDDTSMLAGSEAYKTALVFYNSAKEAANNGVAGAKVLYDELRERFPGVRRKKDSE